VIRGATTLIAHCGDPIAPVKSPMIYNPYCESTGVDAVVVPMGVRSADYAAVLKAVFQFTNIRGALATMPHKVTTVGLVQECTTAARVAGSCNAVLRRPDGSLLGDVFDGAGFVRALNARAFASTEPAAWSSARVASARRSPRHWPLPAPSLFRCSTPKRLARTRLPREVASTIPRLTYAPAPAIPQTSTWWSTPRPWA
jgi:hypothetical protein